MKFALQALFQTFFLEVSRGSFLCERAARFEVDYTQRTACHHEKCCSCGAAVRCWCDVGGAVVRRWYNGRTGTGAVQRSEQCVSQERCECTSKEWCECTLGTQQRIRASAAPMERPCARKADATHLHQHLHQRDASAAPEQCGSR